MRFCPYCENLLIPKQRKLYCKVCNKMFESCSNDCIKEYRISTPTNYKLERSEPLIIIEEFSKNQSLSKLKT